MTTKSFEITGSNDASLAARLEMPDGPPRAYALFVHCFTCGKDSAAAVRVSRGLAARGIATLRFDLTGIGGSDGHFDETNFSSNLADIVAAAGHLGAMHEWPSLLIGHSLGGAAVLAAAHAIPSIRAVATIGAPSDIGHVVHNFQAAVPQIKAEGRAEVKLGGRVYTIRQQLLEDLQAHRLEEYVSGLRRALLVMHAPLDQVVGIENAGQIFTSAKHPKSYVSLDGADHYLHRASDADYVAGVIFSWVDHYLEPPAAQPAPPPDGMVSVAETGHGLYQNKVRAGAHAWLADEPASVGGLGSGPGPYDLLAASLGACTSMTLRMYAERKGWPLRKVAVDVAHRKLHAQDCGDCDTKEGRIDELTLSIMLEGDLDAEQRARLMEIAERCPVHRTLVSEVKVRVTAG